jgi:hypothetical protein
MKYLAFFFGKGQPYKILGYFLAKARVMKYWFIFSQGQSYEM